MTRTVTLSPRLAGFGLGDILWILRSWNELRDTVKSRVCIPSKLLSVSTTVSRTEKFPYADPRVSLKEVAFVVGDCELAPPKSHTYRAIPRWMALTDASGS